MRQRPHPPHTRTTVHALLAMTLLALTPTLRAGPATPTVPDEPETTQAAPAPDTACPVIREADALLSQANSASDAAVRWLSANISPAAISALSETARTAAECRWNALVNAARTETERDLGTFLYTPGSGTACQGNWTPIADLAHLTDHSRVILLVHGLDEPGDIWNDLTPELADAGLTVACFNYPNDQDPALSADALAEAMRALQHDIGAHRIDLVCHSMGGLVARDLLTRPTYYDGDARAHNGLPAVPHLITIGTPNHGSPLAPLRALGEIREQFARWIDSDATSTRALLGFLADGDGAAADALDPKSDYLADLNARPLPTGVKITVIIGRVSPLSPDEINDLLEQSWVARALGPNRTDRLRAQADDVVATMGDAIVTVDSARLEGVSDTVILDANHRSLVRHIPLMDSLRGLVCDKTSTPPAIPVILSRLTDDDAH